MFKEDKQKTLDAMLALLRTTSNLGDDRYNSLVELRFIPAGTKCDGEMSRMVHDGVAMDDIVRPIFKDGNGESGYYDVNVGANNCMGIIQDVMTNFAFKF